MLPLDMIGVKPEVKPPEPVKQDDSALKALTQEVRMLAEAQRKSAPPAPQPAPSITNHFTLPEQKHTVNVTNPAITVNVPETVVNVEATMPEQKMVNPTVNVYNEVAPAGVTVIDNHPVQAVQRVERNANDEIVRTVIDYRKE
jgi:hypothetical protein